jgi:hypothetical protein
MGIDPKNLSLDELDVLAHQTNDALALELLRRYYRIMKATEQAVSEAIEIDLSQQELAL